ncbi:MAG: Fe-S cluster assembly protein SufD [Leptolyngbyaceae cyanobacterium bins.349]|nr:Fe-S cluster assembly protein SufD [Leptolyngbyaceae cyanobacterium bins.349]
MIDVSTLSDLGNAGVSAKVDRATYLTQLLNLRSPLTDASGWLQPVRDRATARVQELAIPSTRDEEWRFTDLSSLLAIELKAIAGQPSAIEQTAIAPFFLPEAVTRLVFVDGFYVPELSAIANLPANVFVGDLVAAEQAGLKDSMLTHLATQPGHEETFTALNTASFTDAAVIFIPKNQVVETPIHLLFVSTQGQAAALTQPRCLVVVEANSRVTLVEDYIAVDDSVYFTNAVTEIWLEANAEVQHTRVQRDSKAAFHIGKTAVSQARDSRYTCNAIHFGAALSRHHLEIYQIGEQTETSLYGLSYIAGGQVADTHSLISYTRPHGRSNQVHKCIVDDKAHAVFNGKIFVPQLAQLTDARQLSKNLLLSEKARVDTKPQLEITADNVKCAHGATVSQLENDEIFYLQSRGINQAQAVKLLTYAFAYEVIDQIAIASLRDQLLQYVT